MFAVGAIDHDHDAKTLNTASIVMACSLYCDEIAAFDEYVMKEVMSVEVEARVQCDRESPQLHDLSSNMRIVARLRDRDHSVKNQFTLDL